jgi:hypothetical protein
MKGRKQKINKMKQVNLIDLSLLLRATTFFVGCSGQKFEWLADQRGEVKMENCHPLSL